MYQRILSTKKRRRRKEPEIFETKIRIQYDRLSNNHEKTEVINSYVALLNYLSIKKIWFERVILIKRDSPSFNIGFSNTSTAITLSLSGMIGWANMFKDVTIEINSEGISSMPIITDMEKQKIVIDILNNTDMCEDILKALNDIIDFVAHKEFKYCETEEYVCRFRHFRYDVTAKKLYKGSQEIS